MFNSITLTPDGNGNLPTSLQIMDANGNPFILTIPVPVAESSLQYDQQIATIQSQINASNERIAGMQSTIAQNSADITSEQASQASLNAQIVTLEQQKASFLAQFPNA